MKGLYSEEIKNLVIAVLLMIVGILFCCSLSIGIDGLSVIIGLILMIVGILMIINVLVNNGKIFSISGMLGSLILSLGILFLASKLAGIIFAYIPWFLIVLGGVAIADSLIGKFIRKNIKTFEFVVKLVVGVLAIALGLCLKFIDGFMEYASILLGIFMIMYSAYMLYVYFSSKKSSLE